MNDERNPPQFSPFLQMEEEIARFDYEKNERIRMLKEKHERELEEFDKESSRLGYT